MDPDIRKKLIREVLDEDRNINKRVSEIQIKNLPKQDALLLQNQLNTTEIQKLNLYASNIRKILEHKAFVSKMMLSNTISNDTLNKYIIDISSIEEIMTMYNYIVGVYRGLGLSQQSRNAMKSIFMSFDIYINSIVKI